MMPWAAAKPPELAKPKSVFEVCTWKHVRTDALEQLQAYVQRAGDAVAKTKGRTLLARALNEECLKILTRRNMRKTTALHVSVLRGHAEIVSILINHKCDVNLIDNDGRTALEIAQCGTKDGHKEIVRLLRAAGAHMPDELDEHKRPYKHQYKRALDGPVTAKVIEQPYEWPEGAGEQMGAKNVIDALMQDRGWKVREADEEDEAEDADADLDDDASVSISAKEVQEEVQEEVHEEVKMVQAPNTVGDGITQKEEEVKEEPAKKKKKKGKDVVPFSAKLVASIRADESNRPEGDRLFVDAFAEGLAGDATTAHTNFLYRRVHSDIQDKGMDKAESLAKVQEESARILNSRAERPEIVIRSKYIDDAVEHWTRRVQEDAEQTKGWLRDGQGQRAVAQVGILGCGLDARAYRLACLHACDVYEVDHDATITYKAGVLEGSEPIAQRVERAGCDLTAVDEETGESVWARELLARGFDPTLPTMWVLEGVLMYLTGAQVKVLLRQCSKMSAPGSEFVCDVKNVDAQLVRHFLQKNRRKAANEPEVTLDAAFTQMWNHWVYFSWFVGLAQIPAFFAKNGSWQARVVDDEGEDSDAHVPIRGSIRSLGGQSDISVNYGRYMVEPVTVTIPDILVNKNKADKVDKAAPLPMKECVLNSFMVRATLRDTSHSY